MTYTFRIRSILHLAAPPALLLAAIGFVLAQAARVQVGPRPDGGYLVPTNQSVTPIGLVRRIDARPKDLALSPDGKIVAVLATTRVAFFGLDAAPRGEVAARAGPLGIAWAPDNRAVYVSGAAGRIMRLVDEAGNWKSAGEFPVDVEAGKREGVSREPNDPQVTGLAVSPDGRRLFAALGIRNAVVVLELPEMKRLATLPVGVAPYSLALSADGKRLVVANRGGRRSRAGAKETQNSAGTPIRIDPATDAPRRGSVTVIDTGSRESTEIEVGRQPAGMAFSGDGRTLYVANSDDDTVSVVDLQRSRVTQTLSLRPEEDPGFGQIPTDAALSGDGSQLFVACGGANAVAVLDLDHKESKIENPKLGIDFLPTGWYPVAAAERDRMLIVASSKGIGARRPRPRGEFGVHDSVGTVQFISAEDRRDLAALTRRVAANNNWGEDPAAERPARGDVAPKPVPERVGEPSLFKHVVYIIKENHTYDLTLGDMPEGNGDRSLTLFGEEVTPNHHALARQFVLLDNTYTSGTNSADGHQWTDSAGANAYVEQNYAAHARSYPFNGGDALANSPAGFLWTACAQRGKSVRVYGEFVNRPRIFDRDTGRSPTWSQLWEDYKKGGNRFRITAETDNAALRPHLHPNFIGFPSTVSDQWRADQFLADLRRFEREGEMPSLCILLLPNNHTSGTRPGMPTPRAAVADNDLALGRIVEALTRSRFWKETVILVIEDDSQLGLDHVDGHRTIAFCISSYTRRRAVVSEPYNHTSLVRTIGLILGLPPMNRFDRTATPLTACFTERADLTPYTHLPNRIRLDEINPPAAFLSGEARRLAVACARLDWSDVDRAEASVVARAVWSSRRPGEPFPARHFHPPADEE